MNTRELILSSLVTICVTALIIALIFGGKACDQETHDYRSKVYTKCLEAGKDPLTCKVMVEGQ